MLLTVKRKNTTYNRKNHKLQLIFQIPTFQFSGKSNFSCQDFCISNWGNDWSFYLTPAHAVNFTLDEFTGTDAQVNVTLEDIAPDTVRFTLDVDDTTTGNIGDITGLFFGDFQELIINSQLSILH